MSATTNRPLYLITDGGYLRSQGRLEDVLKSILEVAGEHIFAIQWREFVDIVFAEQRAEIVELVLTLRRECAKFGVNFIVNRDIELAIKVSADGIHLGSPLDSISEIKRRMENKSDKALVGYSAHSVEEALNAEKLGVDYLFLSPIFNPNSKAVSNDKILGLDPLRVLTRQSKIPVFALGGITSLNCKNCIEHGASGVAVISTIFSSDNPAKAAMEIINRI